MHFTYSMHFDQILKIEHFAEAKSTCLAETPAQKGPPRPPALEKTTISRIVTSFYPERFLAHIAHPHSRKMLQGQSTCLKDVKVRLRCGVAPDPSKPKIRKDDCGVHLGRPRPGLRTRFPKPKPELAPPTFLAFASGLRLTSCRTTVPSPRFWQPNEPLRHTQLMMASIH